MTLNRIMAGAGLAATMLIAACDRPAPVAKRDIIVRSESQRRLFTMDEDMRRIGLKRAMQGANMPCPQLIGSGYAGRYKNMDMWVATCTTATKGRDRQWALFIAADDSVQVRLCDDVAKVGLPSCAGAKPADPRLAQDEKAAG